ncbi:MAG TPA: LamG-like jellyroll fold domain-containing protein, partial [Flavobacterium sp.]|nr:LamG-like jellyroll fold domain-containing protein [Flavobacterium sp.]
KISGKDALVVNYEMKGNDKDIKNINQVSYEKDGNRKVLSLKSNSSQAKLPYPEIGYNYTVIFKINPSENNADDAVIFQSNHAIVKLKQGNTANFGFSHEGKNYDFGVAIPEKKWSTIAVSGDNNSTTLYLNGKLVKKLEREKIPTGIKTDSIYIMKTLFFPLEQIGDSKNAFIGKIKDLKVFNQILSEVQIQAIKEEE